jgi:hypothetical protein
MFPRQDPNLKVLGDACGDVNELFEQDLSGLARDLED